MTKQTKAEKDQELFDNIFERLDEIRKRLPNGELVAIKNSISEMADEQTEIKNKITEINKRILDPETGLVVRVNKNTELLENHLDEDEEIQDEIPDFKNRIENIEKWQAGINKALWVVFGSIISLIIAMFFQFMTTINDINNQQKANNTNIESQK
jgi:archaellum component FlaC